MLENIRSILAEPKAPNPPRRVWRDWALLGVLLPAILLEGLLRPDVVWRPFTLVLGMALTLTLLWRRTHPLLMLVVAFGATTLVQVAALATGETWEVLYFNAGLILLPYALFRWGSGREAAAGLGMLLVSITFDLTANSTGPADVVAGMVFMALTLAIATSVRYRAASRLREKEQVMLREREQLARELHDTVAHYVSAIAIRAQAGQALAPSDPAAALDALEVIEEAASRTLTELRSMVGALRGAEEPELAPQLGVADIERLAGSAGSGPPVAVELTGALDNLRPAVDTAAYRLAQEAITNALRHSRNATRVEVRVAGDPDCVRLTVADDGEPAGARPGAQPGFGLLGMAERAKLLGGLMTAGPSGARGWKVEAVLPRNGATL